MDVLTDTTNAVRHRCKLSAVRSECVDVTDLGGSVGLSRAPAGILAWGREYEPHAAAHGLFHRTSAHHQGFERARVVEVLTTTFYALRRESKLS